MRILIVEDDPVTLLIMKKFMDKYGECDIAIDGLEAVTTFSEALALKKPYELVCLDIYMPKVDGIEVFKIMRTTEKEMGIDKEAKIIMITAVNDRQIIANATEAGCDTFVWKPIDMERLLQVMQELKLIESYC